VTVWYTSDPHWGHRYVAGLRGWDTPAEHDTWLHGIYWANFKPGDVVWWLGDLTMRMPAIDAAAQTISTLPSADHRLIYGNHDAGHPMHREAHRHQKAYYGFKLAAPFAKRVLPKIGPVNLSHFPYSGDRADTERYAQWRLPDHGIPLIHGHTHSTERVTWSDAGTLQIHVGIDAWRRPVAEHEIVDLVQQAQAERTQENEGVPA
jgi:calcineurin-like phosphoesterase family protein